MIVISYEIDSSLVTKRTHNKLMRKLHRQAMSRIRFSYWPRHFERNTDTAPGGAYGYEKRSKRWQQRKARTVGHQKPLVFSGRMRRHILGNARIAATATRGTITARNYFPMRSQRRDEVEAVSDQERRGLIDRMGRDYVLLAKRPEYQRKRKRKG